MTVVLLASTFLLLTGLLAGTLFTVHVAIVPVLGALPGERWIQVHSLLDRRFDPMMPRINKVSLVICAVLVVLADDVGAKLLFGVGGACVIGVAVVSEAWNVRMNHRIVKWNPAALPQEWLTMRLRWANANLVRTLLAVAGFASTIVGIARI